MTGQRGLSFPAALAVAALGLAWLATVVAPPWSDLSVTDFETRRGFAERMVTGELPYRDFAFEYPPLAAPAIVLPGLIGVTRAAYEVGFGVSMLAAALCLMWVCAGLARASDGDPLRAMLGIAIAPLLLGAVIRTHFDLVPTAVTALALLALIRERVAVGFLVLGAGALTKGFSLAAAPAALAWVAGRSGRAGALRGGAALAATLAAGAAVAVALSPSGALDALGYQLARPIQVESVQGTALLAVAGIAGEPVTSVTSHGSGAFLSPASGLLGALFGALLLGVVTVLAVMAHRAASGPWSTRALALASLGSVAAFAAGARVLSPQFLIWLTPLLALALAWRMRALAAAVAAACVLTLAEFPSRYFDLIAREPLATAIVAARNAALVGAVVLAAVELNRLAEAGAARRSGPDHRRRLPRPAR